jgi:hypothetical protein
VIGLTIFGNFCIYMHYTPLFGVNSVMTVIMSSEDYILKIYDMVITMHHFSVQILSLSYSKDVWSGNAVFLLQILS